MTNARTIFIRKAAVFSLPIVGYLFTSLSENQLWGNILSPLNAIFCAGILLFAYLWSDKNQHSTFFLPLSIACIIWFTADVAWAAMEWAGTDPSASPVIWVIYSLTNLFIGLALLIFAIQQFNKWSFVQICVDLLMINLMILVFVWTVFLNKDISILKLLLQLDFTSLASIIIDILIFAGVFLWFLSIRSGKIPVYIIITACGAVLFAFVDMLYYHIDFRGLYIPNSLIDFAYALSLFVMALGALWRIYKTPAELEIKTMNNVGLKSRWGYLLAFPLFTFLLEGMGVVTRNFGFLDLVSYAILIFLYMTFSKYVQLSIENERLLKIQKLNNETLEQRVKEQVKELAYLANQDTLTSLYNRRYFMNCLEESIKSIRPKETLSLIIYDLDRFKTIKDN